LLITLAFSLSFLGLVSGNFIPPPPELPHTFIKTDGSLQPQTLPIQKTGNIYTLTDNIYNLTLEIQTGNIILDGANYTFQGNGTGFGIILNNTSQVTIRNLNISSFRNGISIQNSSNDIITGNSISNNELGIVLNYASNNQISENQITANNQALLFYSSSRHNTIAKNNITGNGAGGIWCEFTNYDVTNDYNSIIENNISQNGGTGILIRGSSNDQIINNTIAENRFGISLSGSSCAYNRISGNKIVGNNENNIGIRGDPKHSTISENTIANSQVGIDIFNSNNSEFYHNDFINNKKQVNNGFVNDSFSFIMPSVNMWDKNFAGNYWSDYNGTDAGNDGTGDTPYTIDSTNLDHYPQMAPYNGPLPQPSQSPTPSTTQTTTPQSSPSPNPSQSLTPTLEPQTTTTPTNNNTSPQTSTYWIAAGSAAIVISLIMLMVVLRRKRVKHQQFFRFP
jgi:parallel beta-helix repeat protein